MDQHMIETITDELSGTFSAVPPLVAATRLVAALTLGAVIGAERESKQKPAGLRTHMLVSMAACLFILVSQQLAALPFGAEDAMRVDPLRLIEAVTAGVAFLAAGIIFSSGGEVHNITTGASSSLARPKSRMVTSPLASSRMLAGLRSRWMIPCSCAASSPSAI